MLREPGIILEEVSRGKNQEADPLEKRFLNEDRRLSFRDCRKREDSRDIIN